MADRTVRFPKGSLRGCTWRRTPKDVDGVRRDAWCTIGLAAKGARVWFYVRFDDGQVRTRHYEELSVDPFGVVPFFASQDDRRLGFWWVNAWNVAERPATSFEIARAMVADEVPFPGWRLLDGESCVARRRSLRIGDPVGTSDVEEAEKAMRAAALLKRREARRDHAAAMTVQHERAEKRHKRLASKWRAVLQRAKRAIEEV